ncbi:hypothetical protein Tco_0946466 [Tanacetum coccineum]
MTKTSANYNIKDNSLETNLRGRLLKSFQEDAKYEHVGQDTRSQEAQNLQDTSLRKPRFEKDCWPQDNESNMKAWNLSETKLRRRLLALNYIINLGLFLMDYKPSIQMIELDENHFRSKEILTGCLDDEIQASYDDEEAHVLSLKEYLICQEEDYVNAFQTHTNFILGFNVTFDMFARSCASRALQRVLFLRRKLTSYLMECKLDDEIRASYDDEEAHVLSFKEFLICQEEEYVNASQTHSDLAMMVFMWLNA